MSKLWPYKVYCILLHGNLDYLSYPFPGYVQIDTARMRGELRIPASRLREYLRDCEDIGLIAELKLTRGFASCKLPIPTHFCLTDG